MLETTSLDSKPLPKEVPNILKSLPFMKLLLLLLVKDEGGMVMTFEAHSNFSS